MKNKITDSDKRLYELNYLVPLRDSDKIAEIAKKISDFIEKQTGVLMETEKADTPEVKGGKSTVWVEKKRLAYSIKNDKGGFYLNSWFKIEPAHLDDLRRFLKLEKEIIRYEILTEANIASAKPTRESVKLADVDKLASKSFDSQTDSRPRFQERPVEIAPKREVVVEKAPVVSPQEVEKPEKDITEAPKIPVEEKEVETVVPKTKPEKAEKEAKKEIQEKEPEVEEAAATPEIEILSEPEKEVEKLQEEKELPEISETEKKEEKKDEKLKKPKKISLEDLDKRLDDILNEEIL